MKKYNILLLLMMITFLMMAVNVVWADDVIVEVRLDKSTTQGLSYSHVGYVSFKPVRVSLVIKNLSDRIQIINLKNQYHFWLVRTNPAVRCQECIPSTPWYEGMPIIAEGNLTPTYGRTSPVIQIEPHSERVIALDVLPDAIKTRHTYKGWLLPGNYILGVETPTGLPGTTSGLSVTETALFITGGE